MVTGSNEAFFAMKSLEFSMLALFVYDYLLTLPCEIELVWKRRIRISTAVYFIIHYLPIINIVYAIVKSPVKNCDWLPSFILSWVIVIRLALNATLIARVYAVCSPHYLIPSVIAVIGLMELVLDSLTIPCHPSFAFRIAAATSRLLFEGTIVVITVIQTARNFKLRNPSDGRRSLASFIMAHGIMYFITVFFFEVMCLVTFMTKLPPAVSAGASGAFPLPVAAILISRFHLDLRRMTRPSQLGQSTVTGTVSSIQFISHQVKSSFIVDFKGGDIQESSTIGRDSNVQK